MEELLTGWDGPLGLALLALVAFGDTLIGIGFFVFGEVAFLSAGALFAAGGSVWPAVVVLAFAWAGDVTSYAIGARYGPRLTLPFLRHHKRRRAWRKAKAALTARGAVFVVIARFLGPVAWVTPFLAGSLGMPRRVFLPASALGVILGVGQFLIYGALGAQLLDRALPFMADHLAVILLGLCILLAGLYIWRRSERSFVVKCLQVAGLAATVFLGSNLLYFFVLNSHVGPGLPRTTFPSACAAAQGPFTVYPGETDLHLPQPVNVILYDTLYDTGTGADLMAHLGWHRNVTFTHDEIGFLRYLTLLFQNTPPISELYLAGIPADSAHQMPGSLHAREHIRWWDMGAGVHFGAISKDEEIAIKYYSHLPVLLHDIDPKVDGSRHLLAGQVKQSTQYRVLGHAPLAAPVPDGVTADFETDGKVLVIARKRERVPAALLSCLHLA